MNEIEMHNLELNNMFKAMNTDSIKISDYYKQINPKEINDFVSNIDGMVELINVLADLIRKYFPNANTYLALEEDLEEGDDQIYAYILNEELSYEENDNLSDLCFMEYLGLSEKYHDAWLLLNFDFDYDEEYYKKYLKNPESYNR
ncbi:MAG: hypothetical protein E7Z75_07210 [Methanobrevibacter olleyae]|uniref:Uncharacterized protein n=1 Tax=Methanobrevibacter olleyae TaxID=294671 RepID=A0A8T3VYY7_METOL|nr:hypothetical protein [Methanobrevibacter olleyae]